MLPLPPPKTPEPEDPVTTEGVMVALLKMFLKKEKKVQIPNLHNWNGDKKTLDTFFRECETWIMDRNLGDNEDKKT